MLTLSGAGSLDSHEEDEEKSRDVAVFGDTASLYFHARLFLQLAGFLSGAMMFGVVHERSQLDLSVSNYCIVIIYKNEGLK